MTLERDTLADEQLDALLADLPREDVPAAFATGVTQRIDARRRRAARRRTWAAAAVVAALGTSTWLTHDLRTRRMSAAQEAAIRLELRQLGAQLERLEQQRARARPVVFLGATEEVDIVVDLYRLATSRARHDTAHDHPSTRTVSHTTETPSGDTQP